MTELATHRPHPPAVSTATNRPAAAVLAALVLISWFNPVGAQQAATQTREVIPGEQYRAGRAHRFLFGADYRRLWTTPLQVDVLDLETFAGGLTPVRRVGGQQTLGLAFSGANGRAYTFRSLDKDPSDILPSVLHDTLVDQLLQDQIASSFPGGAVAVPPLADAAGVLHSEPVLVVMPDDARLGEFRSELAGVLGTLEEFPGRVQEGKPSFAEAAEIIDGAEMWKRMSESPAVRPDSRAFLTARLLDVLIGDWDRHRGQWRWARLSDHEKWQPVPEDRDQAFVRFEGLLPALGRPLFPQFVSFSEKYPGIEGLTWNGRDGDRRILVDLEHSVWSETAREVQTRITDPVIKEAVGRLPAAFQEKEGARLESALRRRRDELPALADRFYRFLAHEVDVHATGQPELTTIRHSEDGSLEVTVALMSEAGEPYYRRTFDPEETQEVRLYLGGGDDSVMAVGPRGPIMVRVVGEAGDDAFDDESGARLRISDASGSNRVHEGRGTKLDERPYTPPPRERAQWIPPRDWGRRSFVHPFLAGNTDQGVRLGFDVQTMGYGFRKDPYGDRQRIHVEYATRAGGFGGTYGGDFRRENSKVSGRLDLLASGIDFLRFYGLGNETEPAGDEDFHKVKHTEYAVAPAVLFPSGRWTVSVHAAAKYSETDLDGTRFIAAAQPYGTDDYAQFGAGGGIRFDSDRTVVAQKLRGHLSGTWYPEGGDVVRSFGELDAELVAERAVDLPLTPTVSALVGSRKVFGTYPFHEAAYIGGSRSLRGFARQRFAGDASVYASGELRLSLGQVYLLVPGTLGVFALGDVGRVFLEDESSDKWHTSVGGGLWFKLVGFDHAIKLAIADSVEGTRVHVSTGLGF